MDKIDDIFDDLDFRVSTGNYKILRKATKIWQNLRTFLDTTK